MFSSLLAPLVSTLRPHFDLSKTRLESNRPVRLCLFQYVRLDQEVVARIVVRMLNLERRKRLALDRTNWKLGSSDVNILILAIVTRRFRVPLLWTLLDHRGNSNTDQRIELMKRYLALFGASSIEMLMADREFVGARWMEFLNENNVPFAIRLKEDMLVLLEGGSPRQFRTLLRKPRRGTWQGWLAGMARTPRNRLGFAARRIKGGELLIVATNAGCPRRALNTYRCRWAVECLFADTKTRGFNIEDTHITDPRKLATDRKRDRLHPDLGAPTPRQSRPDSGAAR